MEDSDMSKQPTGYGEKSRRQSGYSEPNEYTSKFIRDGRAMAEERHALQLARSHDLTDNDRLLGNVAEFDLRKARSGYESERVGTCPHCRAGSVLRVWDRSESFDFARVPMGSRPPMVSKIMCESCKALFGDVPPPNYPKHIG